MKCTVLGWMRMTGTGKDSGKEYDFARLNVLKPIEPASKEKMKLVGDGYEQAYVDLQVGCEGTFKGLKFPCDVELIVDHHMGRSGRMEVICTGYVKPAAARAVG